MMTFIFLSTDDIDAALTEADRGIDLLRRKGVWTWAVTAYCRTGRLAAATTLIAELESSLAGTDAPLATAAIHACRAELSSAQGETTDALTHFEQAKLHYDRLPHPYLATLLAERTISTRLHHGDHAAANNLTSIADTFDHLGATRDAARCRHLSRSSGATQHPRRGRRGYGNNLPSRTDLHPTQKTPNRQRTPNMVTVLSGRISGSFAPRTRLKPR